MDLILFSKIESAQALNLSPRMIDHLIARGEIRPRRVGKRVLIPRTELERFARGESAVASPASSEAATELAEVAVR